MFIEKARYYSQHEFLRQMSLIRDRRTAGHIPSKGIHVKRSIIRYLILAVAVLILSVASFGQIAVGVSVRIGPPPLPVYAQPICPGPGYVWTPGYWAWNDGAGYYWVPGTWVLAPVGMLWTPGYWGWGGGVYLWHPGYWGPHVGFYGGINYGFGYTGVGFVGGEWRGNHYYYNRSVTNVSVTNVTNVYNRTVIVNNTSTTSFNGGTGGVLAHPTRQEESYARERHMGALDVQSQHESAAVANRQNFASQNQGRPAIAATERPGDFGHRSAVAARAAGGDYHPPAMSPKEARVNSPANRGGSNEGFRPFTPPTKSNSAGADGNENYRNHGGNPNHGNENGYNQSRPPQRHSEGAPSHSAPQHSSPPPHSSPAPHFNPPPQHQAPPPHHGKGF